MMRDLIADEFIKRLSSMARDASEWMKMRDHYWPIVEELKPDSPDTKYQVWYASSFCINLSGTKQDLLVLWRLIRRHGYEISPKAERPQAKEPSWIGSFKKTLIEDYRQVQLEVYVSFSSTVCQVKQVRTELKEVPVYETICGEDLDDAPEFAEPVLDLGLDGDVEVATDQPLSDAAVLADPKASRDFDDDIPF